MREAHPSPAEALPKKEDDVAMTQATPSARLLRTAFTLGGFLLLFPLQSAFASGDDGVTCTETTYPSGVKDKTCEWSYGTDPVRGKIGVSHPEPLNPFVQDPTPNGVTPGPGYIASIVACDLIHSDDPDIVASALDTLGASTVEEALQACGGASSLVDRLARHLVRGILKTAK